MESSLSAERHPKTHQLPCGHLALTILVPEFLEKILLLRKSYGVFFTTRHRLDTRGHWRNSFASHFFR